MDTNGSEWDGKGVVNVFRIAVHGRDLVAVSIIDSCDDRVDCFEYMASSF